MNKKAVFFWFLVFVCVVLVSVMYTVNRNLSKTIQEKNAQIEMLERANEAYKHGINPILEKATEGFIEI